MIDEQHVDDVFSSFIRSGNQSQDIKQIYDTLPYLSKEQIRVLTLYNALAEKYNNPTLREISESIHRYAKSNRKTGFKFTRLIEAYSLFKHFKGYKASSNIGNEEGA
jgi:hypothetical protein